MTPTKGTRIYLDANILIHIIEGYSSKQQELDRLLKWIEAGIVAAVTSELSLAEVLVKPYISGNSQLISAYSSLLLGSSQLDVVPIGRDILLRSAQLRAALKGKLPDSIHVATALHGRCTVFLTEDQRVRLPPAVTLVGLSDLTA